MRAAQSSTCRPPYTRSPPTNRTSRQSDGLLGQAAFKITVAPASKVFDITYYDYHRVSVLLTGSRVLIALPSCISNLSLLLNQYSSLASSQTGDIFSSTYTSISHGIATVQNASETLTITPFWCFIAFYTSTSIAAEYCVATAAKYTQRLEYINLYLATTRMWPDTTKQHVESIKYISSIATYLDMLLNNKIMRFDASSRNHTTMSNMGFGTRAQDRDIPHN
jgi:hypothetical protein